MSIQKPLWRDMSFQNIFQNSLIVNRLQHIGNWLLNYVFEGSWLFKVIFWRFVTGNRLQTFGNQLHDFKIEIQNPFWKAHLQSVSGNQLQFLVIDYQCEKIYFWIDKNIWKAIDETKTYQPMWDSFNT